MTAASREDSAPARVAAILAGGAGTRIGGAKAAVELAGRPLIAYSLKAARAAGLAPLVVAKAVSHLPDVDCEVVIEPAEPLHPATGVVAALERAGAPVVVLPCDVPLLPPELLAALARSTDRFAMPDGPRGQPLIARYAPGLIPLLRSAATEGQSMGALAERIGGMRLGTADVPGLGDLDWAFANVNEPSDLERLEAEVRRRLASGPG